MGYKKIKTSTTSHPLMSQREIILTTKISHPKGDSNNQNQINNPTYIPSQQRVTVLCLTGVGNGPLGKRHHYSKGKWT